MQLSFDLDQNELVIVNTELGNLKPTEMTLSEFMSHPEWVPYLHEAAQGECQGNYRMRTPDGSDYIGGYIGKYKSPEEAKRRFHENQLYWALHGGKTVSERVLESYPALLSVARQIQSYSKGVTVGKLGPFVRVRVDGESRFFNKLDCPTYSRVSMRSFVKGHLLIPATQKGSAFDSTEIACIALEQVLQLGDYRPLSVFPEFSKIENRTGIRVKFKVPIAFDEDLIPQEFQEFEGTTTFNAWSYGQYVQVEHAGESITHYVFPSQVVDFE